MVKQIASDPIVPSNIEHAERRVTRRFPQTSPSFGGWGPRLRY